eukprot:UN05917
MVNGGWVPGELRDGHEAGSSSSDRCSLVLSSWTTPKCRRLVLRKVLVSSSSRQGLGCTQFSSNQNKATRQ